MLIDGEGEQIKFDDRAIATIKRYIQTRPLADEAGGVLIGRVSLESGLVVVEHLTVPLQGDRCGRFRYDRRDLRHVEYYKSLNSDACIYAYIGEWHTHPQEDPRPSGLDVRNWAEIWREDTVRSVQYHVIAGTRRIGFWSCGPRSARIRLLQKCDWDELGL